MLDKELCSICKLYAVSPIHAGSGAATSAVDLPIQRERHTNWPHIQASGVKGAFRAHYRNFNKEDKQLINLIFGSDEQDDYPIRDETLPGAIAVSDAKLLAFPIRSNIAPFVWVTCPAVLKRLNTDLEYIGSNGFEEITEIQQDSAVLIGKDNVAGKRIIIEDAVVNIITAIENPFFQNAFSELDRILIVSDKMYDYAVSSCTEIQTQIKINATTGTAEEGALRYQEFLPSDSVLYSVVYYSRRELTELKKEGVKKEFLDLASKLQSATIKKYVEDVINGFIQIGGDETLGKGICKLSWINGGE